jgi:hypothetical protein
VPYDILSYAIDGTGRFRINFQVSRARAAAPALPCVRTLE